MAEAMQKQTYEHKGVTITFEPQFGDFTASVGGKFTRAPSLDAMRTKIDKAASSTFEPFGVISFHRDTIYGRATALEKIPARGYEFRVETPPKRAGGLSDYYRARTVTPDTPENRKLVEKYQRRHKEIMEQREKDDAELRKLKEAIPLVNANDYGPKKGAK